MAVTAQPTDRLHTYVVPSSLGGISGFVDATMFLALFSVFTNFQSGNSVLLGVSVGQGAWRDALTWLSPIVAFLIGVTFWTALMMEPDRRLRPHAFRTIMAAEAALLLVFLVLTQTVWPIPGITPLSPAFLVLILCIGVAAGGQTIAVDEASGVKLRTTFISGVLTSLAAAVVLAVRGSAPARKEARIVGSLWACYVLGAALGAFCYLHFGSWGVAVPILALLPLTLVRREYARVRRP
ncbi:MAG: DUF1275 domain-containing protein [Actinobacteria bacterium]|nr:DUF1275 domain-containing protein [Actinomycetota bacterium]